MDRKQYSMNIALDYDDTYTVDPELWKVFIENARKRGHKVYIVTMRMKFTADMDHLLKVFKYSELVFCGTNIKKVVCENKGIHIDVWIDDQPVFIG